jgi:hypothetical protein
VKVPEFADFKVPDQEYISFPDFAIMEVNDLRLYVTAPKLESIYYIMSNVLDKQGDALRVTNNL